MDLIARLDNKHHDFLCRYLISLLTFDYIDAEIDHSHFFSLNFFFLSGGFWLGSAENPKPFSYFEWPY